MSGIAAELENELEFESESEFELENEWELELESGLAHELELEHEQEAEHEAFFNHLSAMADRGGRSQALRRIALAAARQAMKGAARPSRVIEGELEWESEAEGALELELEHDPVRRAHLNAMMEHMGHAAAEAATEQEAAEHFLPLIPLAAKFALPLLSKALPFAAKAAAKVAPKLLGKVAPQLTRGVANMARSLFRNPSTRPLLHAVPRIARNTVANLAGRAARGAKVGPKLAARTLGRQTVRTLSSPRTLAQTYRRAVAGDKRYHQRTRRLLGRPQRGARGGARGASPAGAIGAPPIASGGAGGFTPGAAGMPAIGNQFGAVPTTGGCNCRCQCQPASTAAIMPNIPALPPACPTCGRS